MSLVSDALRLVKDVLKVSDEVHRLAEESCITSLEVRDHDRRITRLEAQWATAMQLAALPPPRRQDD